MTTTDKAAQNKQKTTNEVNQQNRAMPQLLSEVQHIRYKINRLDSLGHFMVL